jgi:hypothetical protein
MTDQKSHAATATVSRVSRLRSCAPAALALGVGAVNVTPVLAASDAAAAPLDTPAARADYLARHLAPTDRWKPRYLETPPGGVKPSGRDFLHDLAAGTGVTVPYWTTTIVSPLDHKTHTYSMVGGSPYVTHPANTDVTYLPVAIRIHLKGVTLDPTKPSNCDTESPATRFFNSPLFQPTTVTSNGVTVSNPAGGSQLISAFQRANFWTKVQGTSYGVTLVPASKSVLVVDWSPTDPNDTVMGVADNCGGTTPVMVLNINEFDSELRTIAAKYAKPSEVPVTLADDVAIYVGTDTNNCCILGYHNAITVAGGTQLYAVGAFFDTNSIFGPDFADTTIWAHELGELIDDPFVQAIPGAPSKYSNGKTPPWGKTGQQSGCQSNLEVGDPLTPDQDGDYHTNPITGVGGFVYHYQDLAFHDWFYRTPSTSAGGAYSFAGNFKSFQSKLCA